MYHHRGGGPKVKICVQLLTMTTVLYAELLWYLIQFLRRGVFSLSDKAKRNLNVSSSGVGQMWNFSYSYLLWQPADIPNFYDTSYSFCDEEYFHYQTKLREILMYHLLGWGKSETFRTATLYDNQPIYWTSKIPYTVFATRSILLIRQSSRNFNVPSSGGGPKVKICVQLLCRTTSRYAELLWYLIQLSRVPLIKFYKIFMFVPNRTIYRGHLRT